MNPRLTLFGPIISTYGRIAQIIAYECGVEVSCVPVPNGSEECLRRHPFGKSPSAHIDGLDFFETAAIAQYLDDKFNEGGLQGAGLEQRARNIQWLSVANNYFFPISEHGLVLPRLVVPLMGGVPREDLIAKAIPQIAYCLDLFNNRLADSKFFSGSALLLSDLFLYPMIRAVYLTPEGRNLIDQMIPLKRWLGMIEARTSVTSTRWPGE